MTDGGRVRADAPRGSRPRRCRTCRARRSSSGRRSCGSSGRRSPACRPRSAERCGGVLEVVGRGPAVAALDDVELHRCLLRGRWAPGRVAAEATGGRAARHPRDCRTSGRHAVFRSGGRGLRLGHADEEPRRARRRAGAARRARSSGPASATAAIVLSAARRASARPGWSPSWPRGRRRARAARRGEPGRHRALRAGRRRAARLPARASPAALDDCGPLRAHLALLLPELGEPAAGVGPRDAVRGDALRARARSPPTARARGPRRPAVVRRGDARAARRAAPSRSASCRCSCRRLPLRRAAARPRLRRLRNELRRAGRLDELALRPLRARRRAALLAPALGEPPCAVARPRDPRPHRGRRRSSSRSSPRALRVSGALQRGPRGLELARRRRRPAARTPCATRCSSAPPSCPRRAARPPRPRRSAGETFDLELVGRARRATTGLAELLERGLVRERGDGRAALPPRAHPRGALRRRAVAAPARAAPARSPRRSRPRARRAARSPRTGSARATASARARRCCARPPSPRPCTPTATPPRPRRQALELWPDGATRSAAPRRARALRALRRAGRRARRGGARLARARRRPRRRRARGSHGAAPARGGATSCRGDRDAAFAARRLAAGGFAANGAAGRGRGRAARDGQPAAPRGAARRRRSSSRGRARAQAERAGRARPAARARSGSRAWRAPSTATTRPGWRRCAAASPLALEHDLTAVAAELYQRLSVDALRGGRLPPRRGGARHRARASADASPDAGVEVACVTCMVYVLRERGEWARAAAMCRELIAERHRGVGRRGPARRDPRVRGHAQLGAPAADLVPGRRRARRRTST